MTAKPEIKLLASHLTATKQVLTRTGAGADGAPDSLRTLGLSSLWASVSPPVKLRLFGGLNKTHKALYV